MKYKIAFTAIFITLGIILFAGVFSNPNRIKNGIRIEGVNFSGYSINNAEEKLKSIYRRKNEDYKIRLSCKGKEWFINYRDLEPVYDTETALKNAYESGRNKGFFRDIYDSVIIFFTGKNVQVPVNFNKKLLYKKLEIISKEIDAPAKNASIKIEPNGILSKTPDILGRKMDMAKTSQLIAENISNMSEQAVEIPVIIDKPKYTLKDIEQIDGKIGSAETVFNQGQGNRVSNIREALQRISGTILLQGELFSLNEVLGPRNQENGYRDAPVIVNDELVPGMGGGVCQVATTLYKASLQACLQIVERKHHSFPPAYVPVGQDATIAGDYIDFKFKNNLKACIFIYCENKGNRIIIRFYSKKPDKQRKIKIESQILEVSEPGPQEIIRDGSMQIGEVKTERAEKKGYKVKVFRNIYDGPSLVSREQVSFDEYHPVRGVIRIGTAERKVTNEVIQNIFQNTDGGGNNLIEEPDNPPDIR